MVLCSAYFLCYMDRMVMASAIPFIAAEFHLSPLQMGGVLSAFFFGYALMQLPGGLLADRFGPNRVLTISIVFWSVFTGLTGLAGSLTALLVIRVLFGLSEGPFPPSASKAIALWYPAREIGRANGLQLAAVNIGAAAAPLLVGPLILHWNWRVVFYSLLIPGLIMALLVRVAVKDPASPHPPDKSEARIVGAKVRLAQVLRQPAVLWCALTLFFANTVSWGLMNWLPTYLLRARGFSIAGMGLGTALPFLAGAAGYYLGGYLSDKFFPEQRSIPIVCGLVLGGAMAYWAAAAPSGEWTIVALVFAFLFLFIALAGLFTLPLIIVPQEAVGAAFGIVNTVGQVAAMLSPLLVGAILNVTHSNFTVVFYCFVGLFALSACAATQIRQSSTRR
jgi:sugar phosphate permease